MRDTDSPPTGVISEAFPKLRRLSLSFDDLSGGRPRSRSVEQAALEVATGLGATALPLCLRHFAGGDEDRAAWAHAILFHIARDPAVQGRLAAGLDRAVRRAGAGERAVARGAALLAELGAEPADGGDAAGGEAALRRSSRELALCLGTPADVARAGEHLLAELSPEQLVELFDDLLAAEPGSALILLDELLVRDGLDEECRHELRQRRAAARQLAPAARPLRWRRRSRDQLSCRAASHPDGRRILLVTDRRRGRPPRQRALCVLVGSGGILLDGHYDEELPDGAVESQFVAPLERAGFGFAQVPLAVARGFLIEAARLAVQAGRALPRPFYLGRHLLGLRDEHLDGTARCPATVDQAALLERAIELLAAGEPAQALPLLERHVAAAPDDAEGHAQLGLCRLALGDPPAALAELERATRLAPEEPLHHWNAAAAAHRAGLMGACYLSLEAYRAGRDLAPGAEERRRIADTFAGEYARLAVLEHPGASPRAVAAGELPRRPWPPRRRRG
jgi:tetratricopeptide (TPR) repeat protein